MTRTTTVGLFIVWSLLCLVLVVQALEAQDASEVARQSVVAADDNAVTLEGRREALRKLEDAVSRFVGGGENEEAARALNRIGRLHLRLNEPQAALDSHQKALSLLGGTPNPQIEVDSLNGLAEAHLVLKKRDQVEELLQRSLALSEQSGYRFGQAQALLTLSDKQNYDNHAVAVETARKALTLWQTLKDKPGIARSYSQIALCLMAQNLVHEATENYESALQLWRELNDRPEQAEILILLGFNEERKAEWQNAISYFSEARSLVDEDAEPKKMGQIAAGLAEAFNGNGLPENGLVHYQQALDYYRRTKDPHFIWYATWGLGWTYYLLENYPQAEAQFQESLKDMAEDSLEAAATSEYLGMVYIETGKYSEAQKHFQKALAILTRAGNLREAAQVRALIGQVHQQEGQLELARQYYKQALGTFHDLTDGLDEAAAYYALGRLELKAGSLDAAEEYLRRSIDVTEKIRRVPTSSDLTAAFSPTVHQRYQSYIECLMQKHQAQPNQSFVVRAFEISELARARSLTELLRATKTTFAAGVDPRLATQEKSLRQSLRLAEDEKVSVLSKAYKKEELDAVTAKLERLETEYTQVSETIHARYPSYEQIISPTALSLPQIQEQVLADGQTVLLEYSLGEDKSYVWAITRNDIKGYELPAQSRINEAAQKVYELLTTFDHAKNEDELRQATRELSQMVLSPVAAELNKRRLIVAADGALHYIPFQILPASSASDEPFVATTEVINAPSASILGQLREETARRQTPTRVLAAFGDPIFASNYAQRKETSSGEYVASVQSPAGERWRHALRDIDLVGDTVDPSAIQPLFYSTLELANLRNVAGPNSLIATGFDASRAKLSEVDLTDYAILHIATHGILNPKRPQNSGLLLSMVNRDGQAQDGFLGLEDIYRLNAPVDLVVLSACRTGLGKDVQGEGLIGLTRGFMYAGASSVVASLWKVDDEATAELMKRFYTNMLQGHMPPSTALRAAQNSIREQPQWSAPYYWAAFTLQGEYQRVIKPTQRGASQIYSMVLSVAALGAIVAIVWWYFHRRARRAPRSE